MRVTCPPDRVPARGCPYPLSPSALLPYLDAYGVPLPWTGFARRYICIIVVVTCLGDRQPCGIALSVSFASRVLQRQRRKRSRITCPLAGFPEPQQKDWQPSCTSRLDDGSSRQGNQR